MVRIPQTTVKPITATTTTVKPITATTTTLTTTTIKPTTVTTTTLTTVSTTLTTTNANAKCSAGNQTFNYQNSLNLINSTSIETDTYYGVSDSSDTLSANNAGECCDACQNYGSLCLAYSYLDDQKICYIYYDYLPTKTSRLSTVSGSLNSAFTTTQVTPSTTANPNCAYGIDFLQIFFINLFNINF